MNETTINVITDKKLDGYSTNMDNFQSAGELVVTITLNEYRNLVASWATAKERIDAANKDRYEREQKIKAVQEENAALKAENYELKKQIENVICSVESNNAQLVQNVERNMTCKCVEANG